MAAELDTSGWDKDKLQKVRNEVVDTAQYIEGMRKGVNTTTLELTASGWLGSASARFQQAMTKWDQAMVRVRQDLETIAEKVGQNTITYAAADEDVQSGMNRVDALINTGSVDGTINR
ncbi:WXG100 family type VII secretion target [Streptosporangium sandarakinum]|uniref:WXG100 family type VII secretion target n=1 Tax=Streptosporangium sandarakinum TaxID=1260955 RepID=UPI0033A811C8